MAGLYIHIPFCQSRCIYCGFYSTTLTELKEAYVEAVCKETLPCPPYREGVKSFGEISTVYLGGGTPSQLSPALLHRLFSHLEESQIIPRLRETTKNYDDACRTVYETLHCAETGEEPSAWLKEHQQRFCGQFEAKRNE